MHLYLYCSWGVDSSHPLHSQQITGCQEPTFEAAFIPSVRAKKLETEPGVLTQTWVGTSTQAIKKNRLGRESRLHV